MAEAGTLPLITTTPAELAEIRAGFAALLPDTCSLRRESASGVWGDVPQGQGLPCRLSPLRGRNVEAYGEISARLEADAVLRLPHDAPVQVDDHAHIDGVRCAVVFIVPSPRVHLTALVRLEQSA